MIDGAIFRLTERACHAIQRWTGATSYRVGEHIAVLHGLLDVLGAVLYDDHWVFRLFSVAGAVLSCLMALLMADRVKRFEADPSAPPSPLFGWGARLFTLVSNGPGPLLLVMGLYHHDAANVVLGLREFTTVLFVYVASVVPLPPARQRDTARSPLIPAPQPR